MSTTTSHSAPQSSFRDREPLDGRSSGSLLVRSNLKDQAAKLLISLKSTYSTSPTSSTTARLEPQQSRRSTIPIADGDGVDASGTAERYCREAQLSTLLYALHLCSKPESDSEEIGSFLADELLRMYQYDVVVEGIEAKLEQLSRGLARRRRSEGGDDTVGHDSIDDDHDGQGDVGYETMLTSRWGIDEESIFQITILDLLLPPYIDSDLSGRFLSHPFLEVLTVRAWTNGLPHRNSELLGRIRLSGPERDSGESGESGASSRSSVPSPRGYLSNLQRLITPSRVHVLHLMSFIVLYGLTLSVAISPRKLFTPMPLPPDSGSAGATEIVYIVWATLSLIETAWQKNVTRTILSIPTFFALMILSNPVASFTLLCYSIPALSILLVLPIHPSIPHLSPSYLLPLSCTLSSSLRRATKSLVLLVPLALVLFIILAQILFNDILHPPTTTLQNLLAPTAGGHSSTQSPATPISPLPVPEPVPRRIPYDTRSAIFITICLLLILAITLAIARSFPPAPTVPLGVSITPAVDRHIGRHPLDREYGPYIASLTRQARARALREYVAMRVIPPFNVLTAPLDLAGKLVMIKTVPLDVAKEWRDRAHRVRDVTATVVLVPLCAVVAAIEWGFKVTFTRKRGM